MTDTITAEERLTLGLLQARLEAAEARRDAAQLAADAYAAQVYARHGLRPGLDSISLDTGAIARRDPPPADREA